MLQLFRNYIKNNNLFQPKDRLLLAVSGGIDSVVLCELCAMAGYSFVIAHCNFKLRGDESGRDEDFVSALGEKYNTEVFIKQFDTAAVASERKISIETAARQLRYHWFHELLDTLPGETIRHIVTAHHADDNIETAVMNFFRGTGIAGVRGMLPAQGKVVRPLLYASKAAIELFAKNHCLEFVTDSSNLENEYTRNLFRNKILPLIEDVYPSAKKNMLHNIGRFAEAEQLYQQAIAVHKKKLLIQKGTDYFIPVLKLQHTIPQHTVLYEIVKMFGFSAVQVNDVQVLLKSNTGKYVQSATHRIIKNRHWLIITPAKTESSGHILIEAGDKTVFFENGTLIIERVTALEDRIKQSPLLAQLDINDIAYPLLLRKWKEGDYFYPLGMQKKKKLSRFFIDKKLSLTEKENVWVVEMNKKIIWVVGMRIDNRFKITAQTQQLLLLKWIKKQDA